ncbi:UNVERIFIED_CONTAM: hypothetical protein Sindi_2697200, partial [Sesamum indicum]
EFHVVCSGIRPQGISEEQVKLRAFPFSLVDQAKDWLYFLPSGSITRWNDLKRQFLEKYFHASRATTIRKEITGIRQFAGESLFEYWGRFNQRVESCPHHQIPDHLLIQYFYEGLSSMDRKLIEAASGGALFNKTPTKASSLISIMASNTQQFGVRYDDPPLNAGIHGFFAGPRGLRQGDPMSPYLFVLVMEILGLMIQQKIEVQGRFLYHWRCEETGLFQLSFANDLLLFCRADESSTQVIFSKAAQPLKNTILRILGFQEGELPVAYLGLPFIASRLPISDCNPLLIKIDKRL